MQIQEFFDEATSTLTYVVIDEGVRVAIVIDPVLDYDPRSARTSEVSAGKVADFLDREKLAVPYVIDTHAHADHLTAIPFFQKRYGAKSVTGAAIGTVQEGFRSVYNLSPDFPVDGSQFDILLDEGDELEFGSLRVRALHTPGHTPAHMSWQVGDALFVGDTLFAPDYGTARTDFPGGSASELYDSIHRIYALPAETRLFLCHDYRPGGRMLRFETTIAEQKASNIQLNAETTRAEFTDFRAERDAA
ncbi:MAG: MBL fold metallo-hydrolase, partial [bacterium]